MVCWARVILSGRSGGLWKELLFDWMADLGLNGCLWKVNSGLEIVDFGKERREWRSCWRWARAVTCARWPGCGRGEVGIGLRTRSATAGSPTAQIGRPPPPCLDQ
jgi:hypothetical protein